MHDFEVPEPIICSPYEEPAWHWHLEAGREAEKRNGRRPAHYYYRVPGQETGDDGAQTSVAVDLPLVNLIRERLAQWRVEGPKRRTGARDSGSSQGRQRRVIAVPFVVRAG